ncbi:MAG: hypothetical protein LC118_19905, partial [Dehalococcoidia bacterium]|nr:hypothetical protein [Dehalococcoidia bacterium]
AGATGFFASSGAQSSKTCLSWKRLVKHREGSVNDVSPDIGIVDLEVRVALAWICVLERDLSSPF